MPSRAFERASSIHDLDHAPDEAPTISCSSLSFDELSPRTSTRRDVARRSVSFPDDDPDDPSPPMFPLYVDAELLSPIRRLDSAPGRLNDIAETNSPGDVGSSVSGNTHIRNSNGFTEFDEQQGEDLDGFEDAEEVRRAHSKKGFFGLECSASRISACLARNAPCFWYCGNSLEVGATDRNILYRLNILCAFFAFGQVVAAASLLAALFSNGRFEQRHESVVDREDATSNSLDVWNLNFTVCVFGALGVVIFFTAICALRTVREVNLRGAVRYLWTMLWLLPLQLYCVIALFDIHGVTEVWVRHWWYLPSMALFRKVSCAGDTYNTLCVVPVGGRPEYTSEDNWCNDLCNATNCTEIRNEAQDQVVTYMYLFYNICGIWGILLMVLLCLCTNILEGIITKDILQKSRESNVPGWMLLPIIGCGTVGSVYLFSPTSIIGGASNSTNTQWVGVLYVVGSGCFFISALLGWFIGQFSILNSRDKRSKNIAVICFIGINIIIIALLAGVFGGSVFITTSIFDAPLSDSNRGRAACALDKAQSCSYCGNRIGLPDCPQWTEEEVTKILQSQFKSSATFAVIFVIYAISALRFGFILKRDISMYQIDYV